MPRARAVRTRSLGTHRFEFAYGITDLDRAGRLTAEKTAYTGVSCGPIFFHRLARHMQLEQTESHAIRKIRR